MQALGMCCIHYAALRGRQNMSDPVPEGVDDGPEGGAHAAAMVAVLCDAGAEVRAYVSVRMRPCVCVCAWVRVCCVHILQPQWWGSVMLGQLCLHMRVACVCT